MIFLVNICLQISLVKIMIRHQKLHLAIVTKKETMRLFFLLAMIYHVENHLQ